MKYKETRKWFQVFVLPVALVILSSVFTCSNENEKTQLGYIKLATNILSDKNSDKEMRNWAVKVLDKYSQIKFTDEIKDSLNFKLAKAFIHSKSSPFNDTDLITWKIEDSLIIKEKLKKSK